VYAGSESKCRETSRTVVAEMPSSSTVVMIAARVRLK